MTKLATQGQALASLRRVPVPIADRASVPFSSSSVLSDGVSVGGTSRFRHTVVQTARGIRLLYVNWYNNNGAETDGPQDITVKAAFEPSANVVVPVYFGGQRAVTIKPGGYALSDPVGMSVFKGQTIYTRTFISVAVAATKFPYGGFTGDSAAAEGNTYSTGTDLTDTGAGNVAALSSRAYGPAAILGVPRKPTASVCAAVGDSILAGSGDSGANLDQGFFVRGMGVDYAYQRVGLPSQTTDQWYQTSGTTKRRQQALIEAVGFTHALHQLIINGIAQTFALLSSHMVGDGQKGGWSALAQFGVPVFQTTCGPKTTSTDSWATTVNQTVSAQEATRLAINAWLRDGAPLTGAPAAGGTVVNVGGAGIRCPVFDKGGNLLSAGSGADSGHPLAEGGVLEMADLLESGRDSGLFVAGYTTDGIHPSAAGAAAAAACLAPLKARMIPTS